MCGAPEDMTKQEEAHSQYGSCLNSHCPARFWGELLHVARVYPLVTIHSSLLPSSYVPKSFLLVLGCFWWALSVYLVVILFSFVLLHLILLCDVGGLPMAVRCLEWRARRFSI